MKKLLCLLLASLFPTIAVADQAPDAATVVFIHATVIDMTGAPAKPDMTVVVRAGRIIAVGRSSRTRPPRGALIVDSHGKYLIPGLWDMHTHNFFGSNSSFYSLYIANGVTGVRDMGGEWKYFDPVARAEREKVPLNGRWPAPRIVAAGVILDGNPPVHPSNVVVTNAHEAHTAVDSVKQHGADFIKVYEMLSRPSYLAIVADAKRQDLPFAGHVPIAVGAAAASDAGQHSIEHSDGVLLATSRDEAHLRGKMLITLATTKLSYSLVNTTEIASLDSHSDGKAADLFARFVRNGTWICPTLVAEKRLLLGEKSDAVVQTAYRYVPGMAKGFWTAADQLIASETPKAMGQRIFAGYVALVPAMQRAGIGLLAGTDTTNPWLVPGFSLHEELALLVQAGLTPMETLQAATINPARYLGRQRELGTVEKGKLADLVLLDANPLADIHNTTKIATVVANGRYLSRDQLQAMLAEIAKPAP